MRETISSKILERLQKGKSCLGDEAKDRMVAFVESQLLDNQSFMNRSGKSDLYYTLFGWILCLVLEIHLDTNKMLDYLKQQPEEELDLVHYAALKRCYLIYQMMTFGKVITGVRMFKKQSIKPMEKFSGVPHQDMDAPYSQFLWMMLTEDTGNGKQNNKGVQNAFLSYHLSGGGYKNTRNDAGATSNATAAALSVLGQIDDYKKNKDITVLKSFQEPGGGFFAVKSAPFPDLLSSATALFVLSCYDETPHYPVIDFIEAHWAESGGFVGTLMDSKSDVEYCFYGLLALGAVQSAYSDGR